MEKLFLIYKWQCLDSIRLHSTELDNDEIADIFETEEAAEILFDYAFELLHLIFRTVNCVIMSKFFICFLTVIINKRLGRKRSQPIERK